MFPITSIWILILFLVHCLTCNMCNCAGPWQVMLKQADGSYACVAESATRFTLGEVFACLTQEVPFTLCGYK